MAEDASIDILLVDKQTIFHAYESLDWMIRYMEWANEQTGLSQGPSPELQRAIWVRDRLREIVHD